MGLWGSPKSGGPFEGPKDKDYGVLGSILGSPHLKKLLVHGSLGLGVSGLGLRLWGVGFKVSRAHPSVEGYELLLLSL